VLAKRHTAMANVRRDVEMKKQEFGQPKLFRQIFVEKTKKEVPLRTLLPYFFA
jgi:exonuclease I